MNRPSYRTLVLGGNGNVGSALLRELSRKGTPAFGSQREITRLPHNIPGVTWVAVDLSDPKTLQVPLQETDRVIWTPSISLISQNIPVLEAANLKRVVIISSASVHTLLDSGWADIKRQAEDRIRRSTLRYTIIRPTMIYGNSRDRNLTKLLAYLDKIPIFPMFGDGSGLMQPVHIDDLVEAILLITESRVAEFKTYDFGGSSRITYRQLVETSAEALGRRVYFLRIPLGLASRLIRLANRVGIRFLQEEQVFRIVEDKTVDNGPIVGDVGIEPRSFEEGIAQQVRSLRMESGI